FHGETAAPEAADRIGGGLGESGVDVHDGHVRAGARQRERSGFPDPGACSGDDRDAVGGSHACSSWRGRGPEDTVFSRASGRWRARRPSRTNRAVVVDPAAPGRLVIASVPDPAPDRGEAIVRVRAISLNRGEVRRSGMAAAGWRPGWDLAGEVERAAA